eukprot:6992329-Pyramimonas_sp.AAC.1
MDPAPLYFKQVVFEWARAVWDGLPSIVILQAVFEDAVRSLASTSRPWSRATSPAHVFVLACGDLGWGARSARLVVLAT